MQQIKGEILTNKLIVLFLLDKMEIPLSEPTITDICCATNNWIAYMDCAPILHELTGAEFIKITKQGPEKEKVYSITVNGRSCLGQFYTKMPASIREEISKFAKENRLRYRKKQEYFTDYFKNEDGTYTVVLRLNDANETLLDLRLCSIQSRSTAKKIFTEWENKAAQVYRLIYDEIVD